MSLRSLTLVYVEQTLGCKVRLHTDSSSILHRVDLVLDMLITYVLQSHRGRDRSRLEEVTLLAFDKC